MYIFVEKCKISWTEICRVTQMSIIPVKRYSNTKNMLENLGGVAILIVTYQCITVCNKSIKEALTRVR